MVALSFSKRDDFPALILSGDKDQTIRLFNKQRFDQMVRIRKLQLYWKQRTKDCYKIADAELTEIFPIRFDEQGFIYIYRMEDHEWVLATPVDYNEIVTRDGFNDAFHLADTLREMYGDITRLKFMVIRFKTVIIGRKNENCC